MTWILLLLVRIIPVAGRLAKNVTIFTTFVVIIIVVIVVIVFFFFFVVVVTGAMRGAAGLRAARHASSRPVVCRSVP